MWSEPPLGGDSSAEELRENLPWVRFHSWVPAAHPSRGGSERSPQPHAIAFLGETMQFTVFKCGLPGISSSSLCRSNLHLTSMAWCSLGRGHSSNKALFAQDKIFSEKWDQRLAECTGTSGLDPTSFHRVHLTSSPCLWAFLGNTNLLYCLMSCLYWVVELGNPRGSSLLRRGGRSLGITHCSRRHSMACLVAPTGEALFHFPEETLWILNIKEANKHCTCMYHSSD